MKNENGSSISDDWRKIAAKDWDRIKRNLEDRDAEAAGYFLQQALEKYLKAFLIQKGWQLRKIHILHDLLVDVLKYRSDLETFRQLCERVSAYYLADRYPPLTPSELTCGEVERDMQEGRELIQSIFPDERL